MAQIIHSTNIQLSGPWLISRAELVELDKIVEDEWQKLLKQREKLVKEEVDKRVKVLQAALPEDTRESFDLKSARKDEQAKMFSTYSLREERDLLIYLSKNRRVEVKNFAEAFREPALLNECPIGFKIRLRVANIDLVLEVPESKPNFMIPAFLNLKVTPDKDEAAIGLFAVFRAWIDCCNPPKWQTLWLNFRYLFIFIAPALVTFAILQHITTKPNYEKSAWILVGATLFCIALNFLPNVVIGIGKGEETIKHWNWWMKFLVITFPLWVIGNFIWPKALVILQSK